MHNKCKDFEFSVANAVELLSKNNIPGSNDHYSVRVLMRELFYF